MSLPDSVSDSCFTKLLRPGVVIKLVPSLHDLFNLESKNTTVNSHRISRRLFPMNPAAMATAVAHALIGELPAVGTTPVDLDNPDRFASLTMMVGGITSSIEQTRPAPGGR